MLEYAYCSYTDNGSSAARRLLLSLLCRRFGEKKAGELYGCMYKNANGKPCLPAECGLFVSISHTKGYAAAALSDSDVGIDIEILTPLTEKRIAILNRFFPTEDTEKAKADQSGREFFCFWTRREAAFKAFATLPFYTEDPVTSHNVITKEIVEKDGTSLILSVACDGKNE